MCLLILDAPATPMLILKSIILETVRPVIVGIDHF